MGKMVTVSEAADRLHLSEKTVYAMISRGDITAYKFGKSVRIEEADLNTYVSGCKIRAASAAVITNAAPRRRSRRQETPQEVGYTGLSCLARFQKGGAADA